MRPALSFSVRPRRVLAALGAIILVLLVFSVIGRYSTHLLGHGRLLGFVHGFNVDGEGNVPAHFSALMLLSVSILAGVIASWVRRTDGLFYGHWVGLALIFIVLAADELNSFHERLTVPMRTLLNVEDGLLFFTWVVPGMAVVALFGLAYARFLWHLPDRWKTLFVVSGITFVAGAVGVELLGGWYVSTHRDWTIVYPLIAALEEGLEMIGTAMFLYALLDYLQDRVGAISVSFASETGAPGSPEQRRSRVERSRMKTVA
ncbi:MAG: hypothetical protein V5A48_12585 [Salinivenus sp.]